MVPAYNEAATVGDVVRRIHADAPEWDVVVVDDGSTDATADIAKAAGARVLRLPFNLGIGGAVQAGFTFAREHGYDVMAQVDGDGQHDPAELSKLVDDMRTHPELDVVCGSRFLLSGGDHRYLAPISRRTGIHIFAFLLSRFVRQPISDPTSGFRIYNRRAIRLFAARLPARLPRGRGGPDAPPPPPAPARGPGADVRARRRRVLDLVGQVGLLHGQGAARPLRRPGRRRPVPEPGGRAPVARGATGI